MIPLTNACPEKMMHGNVSRMKSARIGAFAAPVLISILIVFCLGLWGLQISGIGFSNLGEFPISNRSLRRELHCALEIFYSPQLKNSGYYSIQRMLAAKRIGTILIKDGQKASAARFLSSLADEHDDYEAWYLFAAGAVYESMDSDPIARILYERILKNLPDMMIDGQSIHRISLISLLEGDSPPYKKAHWYGEFIRRFPEADEVGPYHFLLAKEYEKLGLWPQAIEEYRQFLPFFGVSVPGYPDAHDYARKMVEFNDSPKDWTYADLNDLVSRIRKAIAKRSASELKKYMSKAGFFAMSWYKEGGEESNSNVLFNFSNFMTRGPIYVSPAFDPSFNDSEALLRTSGWTGYIPVWYLCFRKVNFPADPNVHGNWEWAGIYFGEKMQ